MGSGSDKRLPLLNETELKALYDLPTLTEFERITYFTLNDSELSTVKTLLLIHSKLHFILQMAYFKLKNKLFEFNFQSVSTDVAYVMQRYFPNEAIPTTEPSAHIQHQNNHRVLTLMGFSPFNKEARDQLLERAKFLVRGLSKPRVIVRELLLYMEHKRITLPEYYVLQQIIGKTLKFEADRLHALIIKHLPQWAENVLNTLLTDNSTELTPLKKNPKNFNFNQMQAEIKKHLKYDRLYQFSKKLLPKLEISKQNIEYYASLVDFYDSFHLNRFECAKKYLYMLCYVYFRLQKMNDHLIEAFMYYVNLYAQQAKVYAEKIYSELHNDINNDMLSLCDILDLAEDKVLLNSGSQAFLKKMYAILPKKKIAFLKSYLRKRCIDKEAYIWEYHAKNHAAVAQNLRPLFRVIEFDSHENDRVLLEGAVFLKTAYQANKPLSTYRIKDFPKNGIPHRLQPYIYGTRIKKVKGKKRKFKCIDPYKYEFMLYSELVKHLRANVIYCNDTLNYKSFDMDIEAVKNWKHDKTDILKKLDCPKISTPLAERLDALEKELEDLIKKVNLKIKNGENKHVKLKFKQDGTLYWTLPYSNDQPDVNNPFYNQIPEINVTDLFDWVDNHCDFMKEFTHLTTNIASEKNNPSIKACITANATGMGINKMSNNCDLSYSSLIHTQQNNIRLETLIAANDRVINKIGELSIFKYHDIGGFQHGSVDGQKSTVRRDTFMSRYSTKYFGLDKGVVSLNMVFNDVPVTARIIGANEYEGHHLSSMLHNNTSELKLNRLSTDTHGSNNLNFLLLDLWDIEFIPCYKNIRKKSAQICGFKNQAHYKDCIIKPAYKINKQSLIKEEDNIQQIFAAIMMKETPQHVIVKKICSYEGKNKTKAALWAYNDILMSIHILKYIDTLELRQFARAALNRGEGYHQLNANIRSMNGKCFRGSLDSGIAIENECVRLMANNFVYYNGYILSEVMTRKENENNHEGAEFIRKLSLTASQHFNFSGRFEFKNERQSIDTDIGEVINHLDKLLDKLQADNLMYRQTKTDSNQES